MPPKVPDRSIAAEDRLAARVTYEREKRGWSPAGLAARMTKAGCPMNQSAIWKIENSKPRRRITFDEAVAFAAVFEVELPDLLTPPEDVAGQDALWVMTNIRQLIEQMEYIAEQIDKAWADLARALGNQPVREVLLQILGNEAAAESWLDELELREATAGAVGWQKSWREFMELRHEAADAEWEALVARQRNELDDIPDQAGRSDG